MKLTDKKAEQDDGGKRVSKVRMRKQMYRQIIYYCSVMLLFLSCNSINHPPSQHPIIGVWAPVSSDQDIEDIEPDLMFTFTKAGKLFIEDTEPVISDYLAFDYTTDGDLLFISNFQPPKGWDQDLTIFAGFDFRKWEESKWSHDGSDLSLSLGSDPPGRFRPYETSKNSRSTLPRQ